MSLKFATPCAEQWYDQKTQGVVETDEVKMLQDFNIQTDHHSVARHNNNNISSIYHTSENSALGVQRLARLELISQVLLTSKHRGACDILKVNHFSVNCCRYSSF